MRKLYKSLLSGICLAAMLTGGTMSAHAGLLSKRLEPVRIHGPITKTEDHALTINNASQDSYTGEIRINISDHTRILDAVTGYPVAYEDLRDHETAYIYVGAAMTLSLPPMANASMVLCNIPADYRVPEYLKVETLTLNSDGLSGSITTTNGTTYTIPVGTQILPYLTRNIVTIQDLVKGKTCLLWSDSRNQASKIVIFADDSANPDGMPSVQTGWVQKDQQWYYYDAQGSLFTGWLQDNGNWYYLDPASAAMKTGFLTLEGKTYYLQEDGKMLTRAKTFTPDEKGVLHETALIR
ncbi:MAG: hypothetical protein RSB57_05850 [Hungatella sp.]